MCCTVTLSIRADDNMLPPFIVYKRKTTLKGVKISAGITSLKKKRMNG